MMNKIILMLMAFSIALSVVAYAQPTSVDQINEFTPERKPTDSGGLAVQSQAGNTTELHVNATKITTAWQGYYGNVSGEVTLDDADSNTLYSWALTAPTGEIFATNNSGTVNWANITCVNFTNATSDRVRINASTLNQQHFISEAEVDNFNSTFPNEFAGDIDIGTVNIDSSDNCRQTYLFQNNATQSTNYEEIVLHDNLSSLIFATILEPAGTTGFDGLQWNFEMLVSQQNATAGNYYFYVELS